MLTKEEADALEEIALGAVLSITAVMGLFAVREAIDVIEQTIPDGYPAQMGLGSRLSEKYGRIIGLKLPVQLFKAERMEDREHWREVAATLIACGLLGSAYELLRINHFNINDPLWEFFRHTRNAAYHGNSFVFKGTEPKRPAIWRDLEITRGLQGTPLFFDYLDFADVFYMFMDLEVQIGMPEGESPMFPVLPDDWVF